MAQDMKILLVFIFMLNTCYASYNAKIVEELKSNTGDVSLSINIPSLALSDILGGRKTNSQTRENIKASNETANVEEKEDKSDKGSKSLDLAKLLSSGKPVSIKSTETSTMGEKGNTEKSVKEIAIDTLGDAEAKSNTKDKEMQFDEKTISKMIPALKQALFNSNSNSSSIGNQNVEEVKSNPSSGLLGDKMSKATESPKDIKELKGKDKGADESKELKGKEKGAEVSAAEAKPASSEGSRPSKQNSITNQIALVPVSLPSSVLSQLQSAISGGAGGGNEGNMSANSGNSSATNIFPGLASLLGTANNNNNNNDNATADKEMASEKKNETNGASIAGVFNETTSSMTNNSNAENGGQEGAKINKKNDDRDSGGKSVASQSEGSSNQSKPMKKDTPVLVVIPQITNTVRDLTETKSGFFSKKSTSSRVRSGLHKKSKVQATSHKKSKVHKHRHHNA